jgi:hypothetical protein
MVAGVCGKADCTAALSGRCLESVPSPADCPHFTAQTTSAVTPPPTPRIEPPVVEESAGRRFHPGLELGIRDVLTVTRTRYSHLVGILGPSNAGKTCLLTSLYLHACHGKLRPEFRFAGSLTLQGFELRARGVRTWNNGSLPDQFADHTTLSDPRSPAFVHMALDRLERPAGRVELLLSDLPGEWSTQLINRAATANRFEFLARADALIVVVEGPRLTRDQTRHAELMNLRHLLGRLAQDVGVDTQTPLVLVASKCDEMDSIVHPSLAEAEGFARELGFSPITVATASFSRHPERVPNGQGIIEVVRAIVDGGRTSSDRTLARAKELSGRSFWRDQTVTR